MRLGINSETVIAAAAEMADRSGWDQVTLANLAGQLKLKTPSLYNHVDGLPDLRQKLAVYASQVLKDRLYDAAIGLTGKDCFIALGLAYVDFVHKHPGLYEAINRVSIPRPPEYELAAGQILNLFVRLIEPLKLSESEAIHAIRGLRSMVHGFASLKSMGGFQMEEDLNESIAKSITYYWNGINSSL